MSRILAATLSIALLAAGAANAHPWHHHHIMHHHHHVMFHPHH